MIKVCHFTSAHKADDVRVFKKECCSLANNGYAVYLVAPNAKSELVNNVNIIGVDIVSDNPIYRLLKSSRQIYKQALSINADIYHFHDIELFYYGLRLKKKGKKVIFDSHEDWLGYIKGVKWIPLFIRFLIISFLTFVYKKNLKKFDAVITVSPHIVNKLKVYSNNVHLLTNYPFYSKTDISKFTYNEYAQRSNVLCYAGTIYSESNQEIIIKACQNIPNLKYEIIGKIGETMKSNLLDIDKNNKVDFVDFLSKSALNHHYLNSICGMCIFDYSPNLGGHEGSLGVNKIFEYMSAGLPIICSDHTIWKTMIIDKYKCGIAVQPGNINQITDAINFIVNNKEKAYLMGQKGREAVINEFNWKSQEENLLNLYKNIID